MKIYSTSRYYLVPFCSWLQVSERNVKKGRSGLEVTSEPWLIPNVFSKPPFPWCWGKELISCPQFSSLSCEQSTASFLKIDHRLFWFKKVFSKSPLCSLNHHFHDAEEKNWPLVHNSHHYPVNKIQLVFQRSITVDTGLKSKNVFSKSPLCSLSHHFHDAEEQNWPLVHNSHHYPVNKVQLVF